MSHMYQKMVRERMDAGREIPLKPVPAALGEVAKGSVAASQRLYRKAQSRTFSMPFSLAELEAKKQAKATKKPAAKKSGAKPKGRAKGSKKHAQ